MAGIIHKIEEKLGMGGKKEGETAPGHVHTADCKHSSGGGEHKAELIKPEHGEKKADHGEKKPEHKEGLVEKIKDKISGGGEGCEGGEKKKKEKKKKKHGDGEGKGHDGDSSSSSDSD